MARGNDTLLIHLASSISYYLQQRIIWTFRLLRQFKQLDPHQIIYIKQIVCIFSSIPIIRTTVCQIIVIKITGTVYKSTLKIKEKRRGNKPIGKKVKEKLKIEENSQRYLIINLTVNELLTSLSKHGQRIYVDSNL